MAIQPINLGTYANSGTGDDLRTAFEKVNANILELASTVYGANVGSVPPISGVEEGELWWSTVEGRMYIKYGTAWIDASPVDGFVTYDVSTETVTGGASISLNGTDLSVDSIKFASSTNITVTRTDANTITLSSESYTGNLTGNTTGIHTGTVIGNVTGNTNGIHTGAVIGNVTGDVLGDTTGIHTGAVIGNVTGDVLGDTTGTHTGQVDGNVTGNTTGTHTGAVIGNVTGDVLGNTTGTHTGSVIGNASTVTNGVYTTSDQTIGGNKTFSNKITGSISGNADGNASTVTNGVYINGSYANPTWITSLAGSKVSGNISGNAGTVTNGVYTSSSINVLADVDTVSVAPSNGQTLVWNSGTSQWKPGTIAAGGVTKIIAGTNISISPTNGLGDVTITSTATSGAGGSLDFGTFTIPSGFTLDLGSF